MSRSRSDAPTARIPKLSKHKASGQGVVRLAGRDHYLGRYGSRECREAYQRAIQQWLAAGAATQKAPTPTRLTVDDLVVAWWPTLERRYAAPRSAKTLDKHRVTLRRFLVQFRGTLAADFGPKDLLAFRDGLLREGRLCRREINARVQVIRRMVRWGVAHELLPRDAAHALDAVDSLRRADGGRDSRVVGPVAWEDVEPVLEHVSAPVAALIQLQWYCGARSSEVLGLRSVDIDRTADTWTIRLAEHKTVHHGRERVLVLGPQAQAVLRPFLDRVPSPAPDEPLFSPARAAVERSIARREARRSPLTPSQAGRTRKRRPRVAPGVVYDAASYGKAVRRGIDTANAARVRQAMADAVPEYAEALLRLPVSALIGRRHDVAIDGDRVRAACGGDATAATRALEAARAIALVGYWHPHQLRHACATRLRHAVGLDAARAVLGHTSAAVTETYAELDLAAAARAMKQLG